MAFQSIGLGTSADDGTGDSLRVGGDKVNDNFSEIYTLLGTGSALTTGLSTTASVVTLSSAVGTFTTLTPAASDGTALGSASLEFSDLFLADASTIKFGADQDVILTHVADTGLLLNAAMKIQFRDAAIHISSTADGDLSIAADDEIDLTSTLIDINGNVEISGTTAQVGVATFTGSPIVIGAGNKSITITSTDGIGSMEIGSAASNAAFIDLKTPTSDDFDLRLSSEAGGAGGNITIAGGTFSILGSAEAMATFADDGAVSLYHNNAVKLATAATGVTMTGEVTATGFTGTLDGILGSGAAAAATTTTLDTSGVVNLNLVTDSTSSTSGALIIDGGVGVAKKLFVGTDLDVSGNSVIDGTTLMTGVATHGGNVISDTDSTDNLGTTGVRWANLFVDAITATDQITATGFTGTLDGILGSGAAAAATTTTLASTAITASGIIKTDDTTAATSTTDGSLQTDGGLSVAGDAVIGDDLLLLSDGAVMSFGANSEIVLTHIHNVGLRFSDSDQLQFGASGDLKIFHDGSNSYIQDDAGTGVLYVRSNDFILENAAGNEQMIRATEDNSVELYENNAKKFETDAGGTTVTGTAKASAGTNSFAHLGGTVTGDGGARDLGTNYTNSTAFDKLIYVSVSNTDAQALLSFIIGGVSVFMGAGATGDANYFIAATIIWPAGKVVQVNMNGTPTLQRWVEFA